MDKPLAGHIAVVAGATRGAGRGIAVSLGAAGATVYCTGRSSRGNEPPPRRPETIEETAELVTAAGGVGIPAKVDHLVPEQVQALFDRVRAEQGRLDLLVNDVWGGDALLEWGPFWKHDLEKGLRMMTNAVHTHLITARLGLPLMLEGGRGLVIEITDGDTYTYRGTLFYDLVKTQIIRLAFALGRELGPRGLTAVAVTPGFLRSEEMLELFGVTEATWQGGAQKDPNFIASETPSFVGRAVAALAADPQVHLKNGRVFASWDLSDEYGFTDLDGSRPHWGRHWRETFGKPLKRCDDAFYAYWEEPLPEGLVLPQE